MPNSEYFHNNDACYLALKSRDARFDGCFFTGVTSTGIYCRPVCRVRTPKRENCRFFDLPVQAEQAGFRPCLRCRPELAPRELTHGLRQDKAWSMQDASAILANQAAHLLDAPINPTETGSGVHRVAERLGISDRHLRRIFEAHFGVSPLQYLQTRRLLSAKQLLTDTTLTVSQVARLSGFASVRRFNAAFATSYKMNPTQLRRTANQDPKNATGETIQVRLNYRPPYDAAAMLQFFATRQVAGMEVISIDAQPLALARTMAVAHGSQRLTGWLVASFDVARCRVNLRVSASLCEVLPVVIHRVRAMLDLDAEPLAINQVLHLSFPLGDGLRVPGTVDTFELAVRAVLGQQVTVAAGRALTTRLVARFGESVAAPKEGLNRLFPTPQALCDASGDDLGALGIVKQRQRAIQALARAWVAEPALLNNALNVVEALAWLKSIPGIGDWTAQYIAMRALRWPDAFPAGDVALQRALGVRDTPQAAKAALAASVAWQPWRSYATIRAWDTLSTRPGTLAQTDTLQT